MALRDTGTGEILEQMIVPALKRGGYATSSHEKIGERLGSGKHIIDVIATKDSEKILISLKWQQVAGTAEQKVPFEVICLAEAIANGPFKKAYLVLGGEGWRLRNMYTSGRLRKYLRDCDAVEIVTLESFVAKANQGLL